MEKKYNSKFENLGEIFEEMSMGFMTCLVTATAVGSLLLLIVR
jgi:hypothetical protein